MAEAFIEIDQAYVDEILPRRQPDADKNAFGRVLCVCGSAAIRVQLIFRTGRGAHGQRCSDAGNARKGMAGACGQAE